MKKIFLTLLVFSAALLAAPGADAQTAAELERVLTLPAVAYADAAWFVFNAAGTVLPENSAAGAYRFAADNKWLPKKAAADAPLTLGDVSLFIMQAFNIKGGLMYTLIPGPRYAYREILYRKIITGRAYSTMRVSGERLLRILSRALEYAGDTAALPAALALEIPPERETPPPVEQDSPVEGIQADWEEERAADPLRDGGAEEAPGQALDPPDEAAPPDEGGAGNE
jgi:hypothetical protein